MNSPIQSKSRSFAIRIINCYKVLDEEGKFCYYEWDYNPHLVDQDQADVHIGEINRGMDLETILFRINSYKNDIRTIKEVKPNPVFLRK